MPYNISKALIRKMPKEEQGKPEEVGANLFKTQGGKCSLCDGDMNLAADFLEVDHGEAQIEGGPDTYANFALAHQSCNRAKKNLSRDLIRPSDTAGTSYRRVVPRGTSVRVFPGCEVKQEVRRGGLVGQDGHDRLLKA